MTEQNSFPFRSAFHQRRQPATQQHKPLFPTSLSTFSQQEGQHPLTGERAANFRLLANQ